MIDIKLIREKPDYVKAAIKKRQMDLDGVVDEILAVDKERREATGKVESKKAEQNAVSKEIPKIKKAGGDASEVLAKMKALSGEVKEANAKLSEINDKQRTLMLSLPNLPDEDVQPGGKEQNIPDHYFKEKPVFNFEPKNHVDLCESLGMIDYQRGAKIAGSGAWIYRGWGARMEWAILNFFINEHLSDGYELILPPHMLNYECGYVAGQFPKFTDEVYWIQNPTSSEKKFMLPTAETALVNLHRDEILSEKDLPRKYIAYTPCYRREAGSYRSEERGMIRGHQFNKVEMVQYATPEGSDAAFQEMVGKAERLVQELGLHYRVSRLAAGDCSFSMARTYDIEVWIPSMGIYKEVSSASNARDYQARRGNVKYRDANRKLHFVHTLNASGLATSRIMPAIVEQNQNADGSVTVPEVLRPYMGIDVIQPEK
ncbi:MULTISPECIES: serine--tRNA ligase [Caproicibacterium]|jgi:seryl-tRNA synthetase|uniref:Serine--tRNA ligase n=1 Tax=Caproicibacterium lactatifermentans TaxID=2666138 RepID=A0A859DT95_9FIRM|nr:serine--tRNA ligase [Caproicibacterium lactatifermentans]ARP51206.1 serine--tRNA ligase [Ruminococcaceae bacterium CPB6]MDD4808062.1 serine--tRNA ligase [Oscillospiraceae bacterium]QKN24705.1 serine--tRNA ligase [Caproicibacterium lactatifermentans]QKO30401.1 serine--tRNA ligase [Caproicibacterium lactatifermentans]